LVIYILYAVFFISCIVLIASVLLQPGKTDAGALFTSNISSTAFNPRGTQTVLSKITIVAAVGFMVSALLISMPALTGDVSVLSTTSAEAPADANANANTNAAEVNSNTAAPADANANLATLPPANINAAAPPVANTNTAAAPKKEEPKKDAPKPAPTKK
jgi:preprotein translocase subunit SecG